MNDVLPPASDLSATEHHRRTAFPRLAAGLVIATVALGLTACDTPRAADAPRPLIVYCAVSLRPAIEPILQRYQAETGDRVALQFGPSGGLEAQIRLSGRGDLYLPAAKDPFLDRLQADGQVDQTFLIARTRLVLAYPKGSDRPKSVADLLASGRSFGICNTQSAAGECAAQALAPLQLWDQVQSKATVAFPTVTELAGAIRDSNRVEVGLVWHTTAEQFGLAWTDPPELTTARTTIGIGVLTSAPNKVKAVRLARRLAEGRGSAEEFRRLGYEPLLDSEAVSGSR